LLQFDPPEQKNWLKAPDDFVSEFTTTQASDLKALVKSSDSSGHLFRPAKRHHIAIATAATCNINGFVFRAQRKIRGILSNLHM